MTELKNSSLRKYNHAMWNLLMNLLACKIVVTFRIRNVEYGHVEYVHYVNNRHANKQLVYSESWS